MDTKSGFYLDGLIKVRGICTRKDIAFDVAARKRSCEFTYVYIHTSAIPRTRLG
jgi:hypothetical protein